MTEAEVLKTAVKGANFFGEKGIVGFLLTLAIGQNVGDIDMMTFTGDGPQGWNHENPASQRLDNRRWIKEQFRRASPRKHEWIPCSLINETVATAAGSDKMEDALRAARWVYAQHITRSDTAGIIFDPVADFSSSDIESKQPAMNTDWNLQDFLDFFEAHASAGLAIANAMSGHSGALYISDGGKKRPLVARQQAWHDLIRAKYKMKKSGEPAVLVEDLRGFAQSTVWDGLWANAPGSSRALVKRLSAIEIPFTDAKGNELIKKRGDAAATLRDLGVRQERAYLKILADLAAAVTALDGKAN